MSKPTLVPTNPASQTPQPKRKRGAQPQNHNALKHGLYISGNSLNNLNVVEHAVLNDCNDLITHIKNYIEYTYTTGLKAKNLDKINLTLRSLALAGLSLTRLLSYQEKHSGFWLHQGYRRDDSNSADQHSFVRGLMRELEDFVDLSELDDMIRLAQEKHLSAEPNSFQRLDQHASGDPKNDPLVSTL